MRVKNDAWIAGNVEPSLRGDVVNFVHHQDGVGTMHDLDLMRLAPYRLETFDACESACADDVGMLALTAQCTAPSSLDTG